MSNCTRDLDQIVPVDTNVSVVLVHTKPELVALQALPTALTVIVWCSIECLRRRRGVTNSMKNVARVLSAVAVAASSLLTWRVVELLQCDGYGRDGVVWKILASALSIVAGILIVFPLASRAPRLAIALSLTVSSAVVVVDVGFRGWWIVTHAALPLVATQQLWNIVTVLLLLFLPSRLAPIVPVRRRQNTRNVGAFQNVTSVDALEKKSKSAVCSAPENRASSWFW